MRRMVLAGFAATALVAGWSAMAAPAAQPTTVAVTGGRIAGKMEGAVVAFRGVPFAAPPVGSLRWHEPAPVKAWSGVRQTTAFAPACAQADLGWNKSTAATSSEDCLYLNVWAPAQRSGNLPVMIFFPGGAYHGGGAKGASEIEPSYDGGRLAARGAVVITAGYRLGMLGFLAHPELSAESAHHVSGNYALLDQIAVMKWVKDNAAKFGGDASNVTISGQSAGSYSIGFLMTSPLAKPLFAKAIGFSGTVADFRLGAGGLKDAEGAGAKFLKSLGAPDKGAIAALRAKPANDLFKTMMASDAIHGVEPRGPVVDGYAFPASPAQVFRDGREVQVPFMVGNTARDGDVDYMGVKGTTKADAMIANKARPIAATHKVAALAPEGRKQIEKYYAAYPDLAKKAVALYSNVSTTDPVDGDVLTAFNTDIFFRCGAALTASWHARTAPTYRYEFSHGYEPLGGVHLWDMMYVFGWTEGAADQPRDKKLVDQEQAYLINFLKNGDPNGPGLPVWKKNSDANAYMDFASAGATPKSGLRAAACSIYADKAAREQAKMAR